MLANWWTRIEAAPGFGGARRHVRDILGASATAFLEATGILCQDGIARNLPCASCRGHGHLRQVIQIGGAFHAVCESGASQCPDIILDAREAASLTLDVGELCRNIATALGLQGRPEALRDLAGVHRTGAALSGPGIKHPAYLVFRHSAPGYREALGALAARQNGAPFAMLTPTDRFIADGTLRQAKASGALLLPLTGILTLRNGRFAATDDPKHLFAGLGRPLGDALRAKAAIVAQALISDGTTLPAWRDLDELQYRALLSEADKYDVFADEKQQRVVKSGSVPKDSIADSWFSTIRAAVTCRGHYDPNIAGPDRSSAKQIFQRARKAFDIKAQASWRIFKSVRHEDGHMVYAFRPDAGVSFAYIFQPEG
ncbi:MAG TPA: hypothetical protein VFG05_04925 [Methylocella sp.]|nr:hypothetical protein [Methylocella sp.]